MRLPGAQRGAYQVPGAGPVRDLFELIAGQVGAECAECETVIVDGDRCAAELAHDLVEWLKSEHGIDLEARP